MGGVVVTMRIEGVTVGHVRGRPVVRAASFDAPRGAVTALVGPNGAGKSTLARVMAGVRRAWSGRVTLDGSDVWPMGARERAARIAYLAQRADVAGAFTVRQVVEFGRFGRGGGGGAIVDGALEAVGLRERARDLFIELSAGQQQRASLARALAQLGVGGAAMESGALDGRALVADEPTAALDPRASADALGMARRLAEAGAVVVVVLHDLTSAARFADRAALLGSDGTIAASGEARGTLSPERLEGVFGIGFERVEGAGGPMVASRR